MTRWRASGDFCKPHRRRSFARRQRSPTSSVGPDPNVGAAGTIDLSRGDVRSSMEPPQFLVAAEGRDLASDMPAAGLNGSNSKHMARTWRVSQHTMCLHLKSLMKRFADGNRTQAVSKARNGFTQRTASRRLASASSRDTNTRRRELEPQRLGRDA